MAGFFNSIDRDYVSTVKAHFKHYADINRKLCSMTTRKEFLTRCRRFGVFPAHIQNSFKFLFELLEDRSPFLNKLQRSVTRFQKTVLNIEIQHTYYKISQHNTQLQHLRTTIQQSVPEPVWKTFTEQQCNFHERNLVERRRTTERKHQQLMTRSIIDCGERTPTLNSKAVLNASQVPLPPQVELLLSLGPKFALAHKNVFEAPLYHLIADAEAVVRANKDSDLQERARCTIANNIQNYLNASKNNNPDLQPNKFYTEAELQTRSFFKQHPELLALKADKGNRTVVLSREVYNEKMKQLLNDDRTYEKVKRDPTSRFEKENNNIVKRLNDLNLLKPKQPERLRTYTAVCPKIYGQPKAHKEGLPLRPVVPCMTSPTYELSKYIGNVIRQSIDSKYNIRNSFEFCRYVNTLTLPNSHILVSFDVVALFTSIPLELVTKSVIKRWNKIKEHTPICLDMFCEIVEFCVNRSYFSFNGEYYIQKFGTAMGNPLSSPIADLVTEELIDHALEAVNFPIPHIKKYVDDMFLSLPADKIDYVKEVFNSQDNNIQFTVEVEQNRRLPFLDMTLVRQEDQTVRTEWYMKPIASGRFLNYHSHHPPHHKLNVAFNFAKRVKMLSTNLDHNTAANIIRKHLLINDYPKSLINRVISRTPQNQLFEEVNNNTVIDNSENDTAMDASTNNTPIFYSLTNIYGLTQKITKTLHKEYPNIQIAIKNTKTVASLLPLVKDKTPIQEQSNVVYAIPCNDCDACYIGITTTKLKTRMSGHKSNVKQLQELKAKGYTNTDAEISWAKEKSALTSHVAAMDHSFGIDSVRIVDRSMKGANLPILESCHIKNTQHTVNKRTDTDNLHAAYAGILNEIKNIYTRKKNQNKINKNNNSRDNTHTNT